MVDHILNSISHFYPEIAVTVALCVIIIADLLLKRNNHLTGWILIAGLLLSGLLVVFQTGISTTAFYDMIAVDPFASFFKIVLVISGIFIVLFSMKSRELIPYHKRIGEFYMLVAGMMLGMFLMAGATNLLMLYLAFELTSISSYVLVGFTKKLPRSAEASLKYIIFGSVSSGIMIYGISLIYGLTGTLSYYEINSVLAAGIEQPMVLSLAVLMIITGMGFKIAIVPFHFWAPDVYEGAPITVTALLAVASKIAAFAMLIRFFVIAFVDHGSVVSDGVWAVIAGMNWEILLATLAALAMIIGNLTALRQDNIKRMLAYSSIAHAGYMMMGVVVLTAQGLSAVLIYAFMYLFFNLGAFYTAMLFSNKIQSESIEDYKGLGFRAPLEAVALTLFLIALTGIPPTAGFIAKLYIFGAAVSAGWIWLVLIAGIMTIVSLFYYIRVVRNMFLHKPEENSGMLTFDTQSKVVLILLAAPVLILGVYFSPVLEYARYSLQIFGLN